MTHLSDALGDIVRFLSLLLVLCLMLRMAYTGPVTLLRALTTLLPGLALLVLSDPAAVVSATNWLVAHPTFVYSGAASMLVVAVLIGFMALDELATGLSAMLDAPEGANFDPTLDD